MSASISAISLAAVPLVEEIADDVDIEQIVAGDAERLGVHLQARVHIGAEGDAVIDIGRRSAGLGCHRVSLHSFSRHSGVRPRTITKSTCSSAGHVGQGIAVDRDQIGREARRDPADLVLQAEQPRGAGGRGGDRLGRAHPAMLRRAGRIPRRCGRAGRPPASVPNTTGTPAARASRTAWPSMLQRLARLGGDGAA